MAEYRYVKDENGQWHRVSNSDEGRVFQGMTVTPKGVRFGYVPKKIDNSEQAVKDRDKYNYLAKPVGLRGEPGLESVSPEFDLVNLGFLWKSLGSGLKNILSTNSRKVNPNVVQRELTPTERLLKFTNGSGNPITSITQEKDLSTELNKFIEILKNNGVDLDKFSKLDLENALQKRIDLLKSSAPDRYTLATPILDNKNWTLTDYIGDNIVGEVGLTTLKSGSRNNSYNIYTMNGFPQRGGKGVYQRGLNSAIQTAQSNGLEGVLSGEHLMSAPKTYHILQKFKSRQKVGDYGFHLNQNMENINNYVEPIEVNSILQLKRATQNAELINAPVWKITKGTEVVPTKSSVFNPTILDNEGNMLINWANPNIYYKNGGSISKRSR